MVVDMNIHNPFERHMILARFIGTPDAIFPVPQGSLCKVGYRHRLIGDRIDAKIATTAFGGLEEFRIPYSSVESMLNNWEVIR